MGFRNSLNSEYQWSFNIKIFEENQDEKIFLLSNCFVLIYYCWHFHFPLSIFTWWYWHQETQTPVSSMTLTPMPAFWSPEPVSIKTASFPIHSLFSDSYWSLAQASIHCFIHTFTSQGNNSYANIAIIGTIKWIRKF